MAVRHYHSASGQIQVKHDLFDKPIDLLFALHRALLHNVEHQRRTTHFALANLLNPASPTRGCLGGLLQERVEHLREILILSST